MLSLKKPYKVMILDDEPQMTSIVRDFLVRLYGQEDFSFKVMSDSREALRLLDEEDFHILITDIYMPHLPGDEVVRQALLKHKGIQVIVITGDASYSNIINSFLDGAMSFVAKPFKRERLKKAMDLCLVRLEFWAESVHTSITVKKES